MEFGQKSSRLPGFYKRPLEERVDIVSDWANLTEDDIAILKGHSLNRQQADKMVENVLGVFSLPLGVAVNFTLNNRDYLIPMAVEEPSVLAAVSHSAKLIRAGGGFQTESSDPIMIGQIQVLDIPDMDAAIGSLENNREALM
ncbi:MAG: 3-hydroxy-3-methylglutaryl-CoA reductase, partial [Chloroflexota bacterium]